MLSESYTIATGRENSSGEFQNVCNVQSGLGSSLRLQECLERLSVVPVGSAHGDDVAANVDSVEVEPVPVQSSALEQELEKLVGDDLVESRDAAVEALEVVSEDVESGSELLEENSLCFYLADLLEDEPLGELLDDRQLLLDDVDLVRLAEQLVLLGEEDLLVERSVEVPGTEEVVKFVERLEASPVVQGERLGSGPRGQLGMRLTSGVVGKRGGQSRANKCHQGQTRAKVRKHDRRIKQVKDDEFER